MVESTLKDTLFTIHTILEFSKIFDIIIWMVHKKVFSSRTLIFGPSHIQPSRSVSVTWICRVEKILCWWDNKDWILFHSLTLFGPRKLALVSTFFQQTMTKRKMVKYSAFNFLLYNLWASDFRLSFHTNGVELSSDKQKKTNFSFAKSQKIFYFITGSKFRLIIFCL